MSGKVWRDLLGMADEPPRPGQETVSAASAMADKAAKT